MIGKKLSFNKTRKVLPAKPGKTSKVSDPNSDSDDGDDDIKGNIAFNSRKIQSDEEDEDAVFDLKGDDSDASDDEVCMCDLCVIKQKREGNEKNKLYYVNFINIHT